MQTNLQELKEDMQVPVDGWHIESQENKITKGNQGILGADGYFHFLGYGDKFTHTHTKCVCEDILYNLNIYCILQLNCIIKL